MIERFGAPARDCSGPVRRQVVVGPARITAPAEIQVGKIELMQFGGLADEARGLLSAIEIDVFANENHGRAAFHGSELQMVSGRMMEMELPYSDDGLLIGKVADVRHTGTRLFRDLVSSYGDINDVPDLLWADLHAISAIVEATERALHQMSGGR